MQSIGTSVRLSSHRVSAIGDVHLVLYVCVCAAIPFILDIRLVDAPAGVTQEEGHT